MQPFETALRREARMRIVTAWTDAQTWQRHPTYSNKGAVLLGIDRALGATEAVMAVDGTLYAAPADRPLEWHMLTALRAAVAAHRKGQLLLLPALPTASPAFGGDGTEAIR